MSWISNTLDSIIDTVERIGDSIGDGYEYASNQGAKQWNACTGKKAFLEAEHLRNQIEVKYNKALESYRQVVEESILQINCELNEINSHKKAIFDLHFNNFTGLVNRLHNLTIHGESFIEYIDNNFFEIKAVTGPRRKAELYKIDFNHLKAKDIFFGWLTLGFITRKQAKATLLAVKEEEARVNEEIVKMEAHSKKLKTVVESLVNIENYFQSLLSSYSTLLIRFEYGVKSQIQRQLLLKMPLKDGKINFRLMPLVHIEDFQALFNLSIVLKTMATMGYLNDNLELEKKDIEAFSNIQNLVQETFHGCNKIAA